MMMISMTRKLVSQGVRFVDCLAAAIRNSVRGNCIVFHEHDSGSYGIICRDISANDKGLCLHGVQSGLRSGTSADNFED